MRRLVFGFVPFVLVSAAAGCGDEDAPGPYVPPPGFVVDQRIAYEDGLHNENTEMIVLDDRMLLIFRGGETGQVGSERAHINVYASRDGGQSFEKQSEVNAATLPGERDIRDPKLVEMDGKLFLYAISRLPGAHYRDLFGEAWTVRAESTDNGVTWSDPVKTFEDHSDIGLEVFWGFWRFTQRSYQEGGDQKQTLFALGYDDGDTQVGLFASDDGVTWEKRSVVISSYDDVPSEAELQFFGENQDTAVAIVRLDNQGILQDGESAICTAPEPFTSWECGRRIATRLDGPTWLSRDFGGVRRNFVVARKHLPCTRKRTAVYELRGDLANPSAPVEVCEIQELESAGDTAYTALAPLGGDEYLVSWYSSTLPKKGDIPWLEGIYTPSEIWVANIDFSKSRADECHPPPEKSACEPRALPPGDPAKAESGDFLFTVAPVIYPAEQLLFRATTAVHDGQIDLTLQPLDGHTYDAVGDPWVAETAPLASDGTFVARFDTVAVPIEAYPLLADPFLTLHDLAMTGAVTAADAFCGHLTGYAQVYDEAEADRIDLAGTTFGAVAIAGEELPHALSACP